MLSCTIVLQAAYTEIYILWYVYYNNNSHFQSYKPKWPIFFSINGELLNDRFKFKLIATKQEVTAMQIIAVL